MLLGRKTVADEKTGLQHNMVQVQVVDGGTYRKVWLPAERYDRMLMGMKALEAQLPAKTAFDSTDPLAFYVSQLAYTEAQMYKKLRVPVIYKDLLDISTEAPPWAETVEYQTFDQIGRAKRLASNATDIPLVDVKFGRRAIQVSGGGIGYHYTMQELRASQQLKQPLSQLRMNAAMIAFERHMNDVALFGETIGSSSVGYAGLFNNSGITPVQAATGGWDDPATSPMTILSDINTAITAILQNTGSVDAPTHVAMPLEALSALGSRMVSASQGGVVVPTSMSILAWLKANNLAKLTKGIDLEFIGIPSDPDGAASLNTVGTKTHGGGNSTNLSRVVYWVKNPDRAVMHIPMRLTFVAPQYEGLGVKVPGEYRYCGTEIRYVKSVYYQDSVLASED
jgi:hypothetical protein